MDFILLCQLSALPCHFHLLHILFARLRNLTSVLSPWPVDIGHWSSRKRTINLNTITKSRLQKGKIGCHSHFPEFHSQRLWTQKIPLAHQPSPCCRVTPYQCHDLIYRWKYFLFGDLIYSDFISNLFFLLVAYQWRKTFQTH